MPDPKPLDRDGDGGAARNMSLRDWFAGQALAGLHARLHANDDQSWPTYADLARWSYEQANAMILEGAK